MVTECTSKKLPFQRLGRRRVEADFDGGFISTNGGAMLLREVELLRRIISRLAACFVDRRDPELIEFSAQELVAQRVMGLALGFEDVEDHGQLRHDPMLALACGREDLVGALRRSRSDRGTPLASPATLHRLEHCADGTKKTRRHYAFSYDDDAICRLMVELFMETFDEAPDELVLDLDATDDRIHGTQEGRFFHGFYGHYCYLPLYIFCGDAPLCARLRRSNIDAASGCLEELEIIVEQLRERWPEVRITVRADSGFARDEIFTWCEEAGLEYVIGLARNDRLQAMVEPHFEALRHVDDKRSYHELRYRTQDSWSRERRVVAKTEILGTKKNPRFVVTTLTPEEADAATVYRELYCARGDMENRIKEQQLDLFADRTSTNLMRSNQLRLYFSTFAYILIAELRRLGLVGTDLARAYAGTVRRRLLTVGARVYISVRRVLCRLSSSFVGAASLRAAHARLRGPPC